MLYVIPVTPFTLDLIKELNDGVRPEMEKVPTYFICVPGGVHQIVSESRFKTFSDDMKPVTIHHFSR